MRQDKLNRRKFISTTALVAGGLAGIKYLGASPLDLGPEKVRIGVIGTGDRGQGLSSLIQKINGLEVTACCDVIPFRLEAGLNKAGKSAKAYTDYRKLLEDKGVDGVIISTPLSTHDEIAIDALDAGKNVYCEKTMAKGIKEIQSVISKASSVGRVFQTGHQYHSSPLYSEARSIIRSGYLGEITSFESQWNRNGDWRRPVPDPKWERLINWRMYKEYSGGLVAELCSHQIDFVNWVLESAPERITGFGGIDHWKDGRETYDNIHLLFQYPNGVDASFACTTINGYEDYQVKVLGKKGTMILDYTKGVIYSESDDKKELGLVDGVSGATKQAWEKGDGVPINAPGNDPTIDALKQFYDSVVNDVPPLSNVFTGGQTAKCVQMSLDAMYEGNVKQWDDYPVLAMR